MTIFHYKTVDMQGRPSEGDMEAKDKFDLAHKLKQDGVFLVAADEKKKGLKSLMKMNLPFIGGVKAHDKIIFARNLGTMVQAGLPMTRALSIMEKEAKGEFKKVLGILNEEISKGVTLSEAMSKYPKVFSGLFISMVKAGEESGNMVAALKSVSLQMEKSYVLTKKVTGALIYPAVVLSLMIVIGVLMMVYMVPTLSATFKSLGVALPLSTQLIIATSDLLKNYFLPVFLAVVAFVALCIYFFRTSRGGRMLDFISLHTPIIGTIVKQVNAARTARTLSSLITSGVDIVMSLRITQQVLQNSYYKDVLQKTEATIQKGDPISTIFTQNSNLYPLFVGEMVSVGEETGKIGDMLMGVADYYEEEVDQKTKDMSSVIEPFLMIFIGLAVGFFAISMISPIYSLSNSI